MQSEYQSTKTGKHLEYRLLEKIRLYGDCQTQTCNQFIRVALSEQLAELQKVFNAPNQPNNWPSL